VQASDGHQAGGGAATHVRGKRHDVRRRLVHGADAQRLRRGRFRSADDVTRLSHPVDGDEQLAELMGVVRIPVVRDLAGRVLSPKVTTASSHSIRKRGSMACSVTWDARNSTSQPPSVTARHAAVSALSIG
jgi:hypothetical protein